MNLTVPGRSILSADGLEVSNNVYATASCPCYKFQRFYLLYNAICAQAWRSDECFSGQGCMLKLIHGANKNAE